MSYTQDNWKASDVVADTNRWTPKYFHSRVVRPAIESIDAQTAELAARSEAGDLVTRAIALPVQEMIRRDTTIAFCLVIQSQWERGFRRYVAARAKDIGEPGLAKKAICNDWNKVEEAFFAVRGIDLKQLPHRDKLVLLQSLGSACRHGPGKKLDALSVSNPELWPEREGPSPQNDISMIGLCISPELLEEFVEAIAAFWNALIADLIAANSTSAHD